MILEIFFLINYYFYMANENQGGASIPTSVMPSAEVQTDQSDQGKKGKNKGKTPPAAPPASGTQFLRNIFLQKEETGVTFDDRHRKKEGVRSEYVQFSEPLRAQYKTFLRDHTQNLVALRGIPHPTIPNRSILDEVLENPNHVYDLEFVNKLTNSSFNSRGELLTQTVDGNKIENFLNTPEGWILTTALLEQQTAMKLFGLALRIATQPQGNRSDLSQTGTVQLDIDQGTLNKFFRNLGHDLNQPVARPGGRTNPNPILNVRRWQALASNAALGGSIVAASSIGGAIGGLLGPLGMGAGAALGAGLGAVEAGITYSTEAFAISTFKNGVQLDMARCGGAFDSIADNPVEKEYLARVYGIYTDDFVHTAGTNTFTARPNRRDLQTNGIEELQKELLGAIYTRAQYHLELGIPAETLEATPEQFFLTGQARSENIKTRAASRIDELYRRFRPAAPDAKLESEAMFNARRQYIMEQFTQVAKIAEASKENAKNPAQEIGGRKSIITDRLDKRLDAEKNALDKDITVVGTIQTGVFKPYADALDAINNARAAATRETISLQPASPFDIDAEIRLRTDRLTNATTGIPHDTEEAENEIANLARTTPTAGLSPNAAGLVISNVVKPFERRLERLQAEEVRLRSEIDSLNKHRADILTAQASLAENSPTTQTYERTEREMDADRRLIIALGTPPLSISDAELATLTLRELQTRINNINRTTPGQGWREEDNQNPGNRRQLLNAIIDARAEALANQDPSRAARTGAHGNILAYGISNTQLRTLHIIQLQQLIDDEYARRGGTGVNPGGPANLNLAIAEAQQRFQVRNTTLGLLGSDLQTWSEATTEEKARIERQPEIRNITAIGILANNLEDVLDNASEIISQLQYTNRDPIPAAGTPTAGQYIDAERTVGVSIGYTELMQYLFGYKTNAEFSREDFFNAILRVLPPEELAERLNTSLRLSVPGTPPLLDNVLHELRNQTRGANVRVTAMGISNAFRGIITTKVNEGLAINV